MNLAIKSVKAIPAYIPVNLAIGPVDVETALSCVVIEITTEDGVVGHGFTAITDEEVIAGIIKELVEPNIVSLNSLNREHIAERLYWLLSPRGQTGYASHVVSAVDLALWDILGKAVDQPCWRLLGGARTEVPLYVTFGFGSFDRDQLSDAARHLKNDGVERFKMVVGHHALKKRNDGASVRAIIEEDIERVRIVREAIGDCDLFIDANCSLDASSARYLADRLGDYNVTFFEEPLRDNDVKRMRDLREQTGMRTAAGQNEGQLFRFRDLLEAGAVDVIQPNVAICGGAFPFHNMHLHGGMANGGLVEWHLISVEMCRALYGNLPDRVGSTITLPEEPGLGFVADADALRDFASRPTSHGVGKG